MLLFMLPVFYVSHILLYIVCYFILYALKPSVLKCFCIFAFSVKETHSGSFIVCMYDVRLILLHSSFKIIYFRHDEYT